MGWAVVQSAKKAATSAIATTGAAAFGTNLSSGTKIIAAVSVPYGTVSGVSDGTNSLTLIGRKTVTNLLDVSLWAMDTPAGDVGTKPTITATLTNSAQSSVLIQEVSGLLPGNTTAMADGTPGSNTGTGGASTGSPAYTSTASNEYLVSVYGDDGGPETFTKPTALTADANSVNANSYDDIAIAYGNSTNGTEAGSWALAGTSADWATLLVAFQLAAAGTPISGADTGTGTDTATVNQGGQGYDAGTGTEAASGPRAEHRGANARRLLQPGRRHVARGHRHPGRHRRQQRHRPDRQGAHRRERQPHRPDRDILGGHHPGTGHHPDGNRLVGIRGTGQRQRQRRVHRRGHHDVQPEPVLVRRLHHLRHVP